MLNGIENFLDSYAIIEILKGNPRYEKFSEKIAATGKVNLIEVAYHLAQYFPEEKALQIIDSLKIKIIEIKETEITKIAFFRKEHSKKKFSYIDCIGYIIAKENNLKFITGDQAFNGMPNVEFVK